MSLVRPTASAGAPTWTGPAAGVARALRAIRHAVAPAGDVRGLDGVLVEVVDSVSEDASVGAALRVVATDGHRLAYEDVPGTGVLGVVGRRTVLAANGVSELLVALDGAGKDAIVTVFGGAGDGVCVSGLAPVWGFEPLGVPCVNFDFPDYRAVVSTREAKVRVTVDRKALLAAVKAATPKAYKQPNWPQPGLGIPEAIAGGHTVDGPRYIHADGSFVQRSTGRGRKWLSVGAAGHVTVHDGLDVALGSHGRAADVSVPAVVVRFDYDGNLAVLPARSPYAPADTVWPVPAPVAADGYGFDDASRWDGVGFDARYLREALASITTKTVTLGIDHPLAPLHVRGGTGSGDATGLRLVMPRRLG